MPMYRYFCSKCGTTADVLRSFSEYQRPPEDEELKGLPPTVEPCTHEWEREIGTTRVIKGPNWGWGSKGNW